MRARLAPHLDHQLGAALPARVGRRDLVRLRGAGCQRRAVGLDAPRRGEQPEAFRQRGAHGEARGRRSAARPSLDSAYV